MPAAESAAALLDAGAVLAVLTTYPFLATTLSYRQRDNGLAFIVLLMGVGVWNGFLAAQLLTDLPRVASYFLGLSMVGALLAALGWFLFATTASSTPDVGAPRLVYGLVALFVGADISLLVTNPVHGWFWQPPMAAGPATFAAVDPTVGYWVHSLLVVTLFLAGMLLFGAAWEGGHRPRYAAGYTIGALVTAVAVIGGNVAAPGGWTVAPLVAVWLTSVGWVQAQRGAVVSVVWVHARRLGAAVSGSAVARLRPDDGSLR